MPYIAIKLQPLTQQSRFNVSLPIGCGGGQCGPDIRLQFSYNPCL